MRIMQVKEYNESIARVEEQEALARWRAKDNGYGYPVRTMFYFSRTDNKGYALGDRVKGYVAFDDCKASFGMNEQKAIERFNR
uniref:Uncharacterized protein n=1 Tax=viral metagenome TaxID=1070528 RepID=A0A6M3IXF8_9ZZZZ